MRHHTMAHVDPPAVTDGLAPAASWGRADFYGGMAIGQNGVIKVIIVSQVIGLGLLTAPALLPAALVALLPVA